jgi:hypothetical protein
MHRQRQGLITRGMKQTGERSAGKPHATFEAVGAGNEMMAAGLRATAKAMEQPPEPKVGAPVLDPTDTCSASPIWICFHRWGR